MFNVLTITCVLQFASECSDSCSSLSILSREKDLWSPCENDCRFSLGIICPLWSFSCSDTTFLCLLCWENTGDVFPSAASSLVTGMCDPGNLRASCSGSSMNVGLLRERCRFSSMDISNWGKSFSFGSFCFFLSFLAAFVILCALERGGVQRAFADCKKKFNNVWPFPTTYALPSYNYMCGMLIKLGYGSAFTSTMRHTLLCAISDTTLPGASRCGRSTSFE